jgi:hypothetical protein
MPFDPITLGYAGRRLDDLAIETAAFVEALELLSFPRRLNPTTGSRN